MSFIYSTNILHNNQVGFRTSNLTNLAIANVLPSIISKAKNNKKVEFAYLISKRHLIL